MRNPLRPVFLLTAMVLLVAAGTGLAQWIGEIEAWGLNDYNQCDVPDSAPFVAVSAGNEHSLGLREDGSIVVWGSITAWPESPVEVLISRRPRLWRYPAPIATKPLLGDGTLF